MTFQYLHTPENLVFINSLKSNKILSFVKGCLLEGSRPPPDVPPRNPTMSRLNGRITGNPADLSDFEPSCLVRTPSGNFYVPSGKYNKTVFY